MELSEILGPKRIEIVLSDYENQILNEQTKATVRNYTARRDQPHFNGDQYHAHVDLPKGYEISWNIDGTRRHPGKFPATIPKDAIAAVAKVLGVTPDILECYQWHDEANNEDVYIVEVHGKPGSGEKALPQGWL